MIIDVFLKADIKYKVILKYNNYVYLYLIFKLLINSIPNLFIDNLCTLENIGVHSKKNENFNYSKYTPNVKNLPCIIRTFRLFYVLFQGTLHIKLLNSYFRNCSSFFYSLRGYKRKMELFLIE